MRRADLRQTLSEGSSQSPISGVWGPGPGPRKCCHSCLQKCAFCMQIFLRKSREKLYPPPPFWLEGNFQGRRMGGVVNFFEPLAAGILYPPSSIHPPPLEGHFQGEKLTQSLLACKNERFARRFSSCACEIRCGSITLILLNFWNEFAFNDAYTYIL